MKTPPQKPSELILLALGDLEELKKRHKELFPVWFKAIKERGDEMLENSVETLLRRSMSDKKDLTNEEIYERRIKMMEIDLALMNGGNPFRLG